MESRVFSSGHPGVIHYGGRRLLLFRVDGRQLTRIAPTAVMALDQLPIRDEERGSPIKSVTWLLREGYLPQFQAAEHQHQTAALLYSGDILLGVTPAWAIVARPLADEDLIEAEFPSFTDDLLEPPPKSPDSILLDANPFARYRYSGLLETFPLALRRTSGLLE